MIPANLISSLFNIGQLVVIPVTATQLLSAQTMLLLKASGADTATNSVILDSSLSPKTVTTVGNVIQGSVSPFSPNGWSALFNASTDVIRAPASASLAVGTADFTFEAWVNVSTLPTDPTHGRIIGGDILWSGGYQGGWYLSVSATMGLRYNYSGSSGAWTGSESTGSLIKLSTWRHVAVSRNSSVSRIFLDGLLVLTVSNNTQDYGTGRIFHIGALLGDGNYFGLFKGSLSNIRLVKGTGLYTENFVPSTTALASVPGTSLLTLQDNRFKDNSPSLHQLTTVGVPTIRPISPFRPSEPYSPETHGGSAYLGGATEYFSCPNVNLGAGNFTVEGWFYPTTLGNLTNFWGISNGGGFVPKMIMYISAAGALTLDMGNAGTTQVTMSVPGTVLTANAFNHMALVRTGLGVNQVLLFINGVQVGSGQIGTNLSTITGPVNVGRIGEPYGQTFTGYVSGFKITTGEALYTAPFPVPTALSSAAANTALLLKFTNSGITDAAAKNDTRTIGSAQASTAIVKYNSGSIKFNGSTDFVSIANSPQFDLSVGDFTIEAWINSQTPYRKGVCGSRTSGATHGWGIYIGDSGELRFANLIGGWFDQKVHSTLIKANTWHHIAIVRAGNVYTCYVDGAGEIITGITTQGLHYISSLPIYVGAVSSAGEYPFVGYIEDFRITAAAVYTSDFIPPTIAAGDTLAGDPYLGQVQLLLDGNISDGLVDNNVILDSSLAPLVVAKSGILGQGSRSPFSRNGWSVYCPAGAALTSPTNTEFNLPGQFTLETWVNPSSVNFGIFSRQGNGGQVDWAFQQGATNNWGLFVYVGAYGAYQTELYTGVYLALNTWSHVAITRDAANTWRIFVNGASVPTYIFNQNSTWNNAAPLTNTVGATLFGPSAAASYYNFRLVKGSAIYTSSFVPSTEPLTAVAGTLLLTGISSVLKDYSANGFPLTLSGAPVVRQSSPAPLVPYSRSIHGGSLAFIESAAAVTTSAVPAIGTQDFTFETWLNVDQATGAYAQILSVAGILALRFGDAGFGYKLQASCYMIGGVGGVYSCALTSTNFVNSWTHIAFTRASGVCRLFINGTLTPVANGVNPGTYGVTSWTDNTSITSGPASVSNYGMLGYQSNTRLVVGTALYTASFQPPVEALTAVPGTQLLLSGTNAGLVDRASKSDVVTHGTAVLSSAQKKFGTASMYFDGGAQSCLKLSPGALNFSTSDFTVELWYYPTASANSMARLFQTVDGDFVTGLSIIDNAGVGLIVAASSNGASWDVIPSTQVGTFVRNTWHHIVVRRIGSTFSVFLNGVRMATFSSTAALYFNSAQTPVIGGQTHTSYPAKSITGYIDDLRVTIGKGRYTVEPTAAL